MSVNGVESAKVITTGGPVNNETASRESGSMVSIHGTEIVQENSTDFSESTSLETPGKEAFKHFGKKFDDLAQMDTNNTLTEVQMMLDDFSAEFENAKLPKLRKAPNPANFEKGKDGYQAYKMALLNYKNTCSKKIENAERKAERAREKSLETVVRETAHQTQGTVVAAAGAVIANDNANTEVIMANDDANAKSINKNVDQEGAATRATVRKEGEATRTANFIDGEITRSTVIADGQQTRDAVWYEGERSFDRDTQLQESVDNVGKHVKKEGEDTRAAVKKDGEATRGKIDEQTAIFDPLGIARGNHAVKEGVKKGIKKLVE